MPTDSLTLDDFQRIVSGMGFECTRSPNGPFFTFMAQGYNVAASSEEDNRVLQLDGGFSDVTISYELTNEWNRTHRFCTAYADENGRARFCYELDLSGGCATDANVQQFVNIYRNVVGQWAQFCLQHKS
jgi:hypothetical protein